MQDREPEVAGEVERSRSHVAEGELVEAAAAIAASAGLEAAWSTFASTA